MKSRREGRGPKHESWNQYPNGLHSRQNFQQKNDLDGGHLTLTAEVLFLRLE